MGKTSGFMFFKIDKKILVKNNNTLPSKKFFTNCKSKAASIEEDQSQTLPVNPTNKSDLSPADFVASLTTDEEVAAYYNSGVKKKEDKLQENVVQIRRVTKVVKGGKQLSFRAVVIVGDDKGTVGVGVASAKEVIKAVGKAAKGAKENIINVPLTKSYSIPHRIEGRSGASRVMLRPANEGTGVVAGGATRLVLEAAGIRNIFGKQLRSDNTLNNARATIEGLKALRTFPQVANERGISLEQLLGSNL